MTWPWRTDARILDANRKLKGQAADISRLRGELAAAVNKHEAYKRIQDRIRAAEKDVNARRIEELAELRARNEAQADLIERLENDHSKTAVERLLRERNQTLDDLAIATADNARLSDALAENTRLSESELALEVKGLQVRLDKTLMVQQADYRGISGEPAAKRYYDGLGDGD